MQRVQAFATAFYDFRVSECAGHRFCQHYIVALISVTRLRIRSVWYMPGFLWLALRSAHQAKRAPGNLGTSTLQDARRTFWTKTAWHNEASMRAFMLAGSHKQAMSKLANWCDEASVVQWTQDSAELPDWSEAHRRMQSAGRRSRVLHPSPAHEAFQITPPRAS
jgi:hypothetical protein